MTGNVHDLQHARVRRLLRALNLEQLAVLTAYCRQETGLDMAGRDLSGLHPAEVDELELWLTAELRTQPRPERGDHHDRPR